MFDKLEFCNIIYSIHSQSCSCRMYFSVVRSSVDCDIHQLERETQGGFTFTIPDVQLWKNDEKGLFRVLFDFPIGDVSFKTDPNPEASVFSPLPVRWIT